MAQKRHRRMCMCTCGIPTSDGTRVAAWCVVGCEETGVTINSACWKRSAHHLLLCGAENNTALGLEGWALRGAEGGGVVRHGTHTFTIYIMSCMETHAIQPTRFICLARKWSSCIARPRALLRVCVYCCACSAHFIGQNMCRRVACYSVFVLLFLCVLASPEMSLLIYIQVFNADSVFGSVVF